MNPKQVEASTTSNRASVYKSIAAVFDQLPDKFKAGELYELADMKSIHAVQRRMLIASVLSCDFRCDRISKPSGLTFWKKPSPRRNITL